MFSLALTAATHNPCLIILREKGYRLRISCGRRRSGSSDCVYMAEAEGRRFAAMSGPELLGLVTLWEHFGEDWKRQTPDIEDEVTVIEDEEDGDEPGVFVTGS
jgi:hypothetical protein